MNNERKVVNKKNRKETIKLDNHLNCFTFFC